MKLTKKQVKAVKKFLKIRSKEVAKTLNPIKFQDKEHLKLSAELIAWCDLLLYLSSK